MNKKIKKGLIILLAIIIPIILTGCKKDTKEKIIYEIVFDSNGGSYVETQNVEEGNTITYPENPTKEGYYFKYWEYNGKKYNFNNKVNNNMTLFAIWEEVAEIKKYRVTFDSDEGSFIDSVLIEEGKKIEKYETPTKEGYIFKGWYLEDNLFDFETSIDSDILLKAKWEEQAKVTYNVSFESNGGTKIDNQIVNENSTVIKPSNPVKKGYTFKEWQLDNMIYDFNTPVNKDITLKALWGTQKYVITFDSDGGTKIESQSITYNDKITKPSDPIKKGSIFLGWYYKNSEYNFDAPVNSDIVLTAKWNTIISLDGLINNSYFNIKKESQTESEALETTNGINEAIKYASENNIKNIKLEQGTYVIKADIKSDPNNANEKTQHGINMKSNIYLDLNNSVIKIYPTASIRYAAVQFDGVSNSSIYNGTIEGEKYVHDYLSISPNSTHEWGCGIRIINKSKNISVHNLEIMNTTGDGITISNKENELNKSGVPNIPITNKLNNNTHNITIENNKIHSFRRNGISIISGDDILISKNKIYDCINEGKPNNGTYDSRSVEPRAGIDIERDDKYQIYSNIKIDSNKIYDISGPSISIFEYFKNIQYSNNTLSRRILIRTKKKNLPPFTYSSNTIEDLKNETNFIITGNAYISSTDSEVRYPNSIDSTEEIINFHKRVEQVVLASNEINVKVGNSVKINKTITPSDAKDKTMTWLSSNTNIVAVDENGKVTGKSVGTVTITGTTNDGSNISVTCIVNVTN